MAKTCTVKPAAGRRVINPATMRPLPAEGELVEWGTFWIRLRNAGDIVVVEPKPAAKPAAKSAAKE